LFANYLAEAGVQRHAEMMYSDPEAWRGITSGLVEGFVKWQIGKGYAISSINVRLSTVKTYCRLAAKATVLHVAQYNAIRLAQGYRHHEGRNIDRSRTVNRVGAKKAEPTKINAGHAAKLKVQPDTRQGRRDALLMCLLLDLGMRCSEIAGLQVNSIDLVDSSITFYREKVDLLQVHELRGAALDASMAYLPDVTGQEYLFPGYAGKPITTRAINDRVRTLGRMLPKEYRIENLSPHDCRHYWATLAMRSGTDVAALQQAGG
jgi:integrase